MEKVYDIGPIDVRIEDDNHNIDAVTDVVIANNVDDTLTIVGSCIDSLYNIEDAKRQKLKDLFGILHKEVLNNDN
jgi:hypothetical protein